MMIKKTILFVVSFYTINIISYFIYWRTVSVKSFDRISQNPDLVKTLKEKGSSIEIIKESFLKTDTQIFNPFFNFGFYFSGLKFIPGLLLSIVLIYFINRKNKK